MQASLQATAGWESNEARLRSFATALDHLRVEVEANLGATDAKHIERVLAWSTRFEVLGRGLIHFSLEPASFLTGVAFLWLHKSLELMEIGHMALHGAYDRMPGLEPLHGVRYLSAGWNGTLRGVLRELRRLALPDAASLAAG